MTRDDATGVLDDDGVTPAVRAVYGPQDLSSVPAFLGGFINFGHWDGIPLDRPFTAEDRVRSARNLYRHVLSTLTAPGGAGVGGRRGRAVEVGCGLGLGCALALEEFAFDSVTGMDIHPDQLERARGANAALLSAAPERFRFARGAAESMPFTDGEFDRLYSVEAAQHFRDLAAFARESARVLRPGGRMAVTSFFVPGDAKGGVADALAGRLDSFASGLDVAHPVGTLVDALAAAGLTEVRTESIGESVWPGFDRFLAAIELPVTWPRNFLGAYRDGLLDYYVITARRPGGV
ncbi:class I SAM-dependent methyltransferase [Streptomyces sp. TRM49041]|uniref:class I SAM-dependent methyltransferase n=1 Tax=Streptomyces sp. TRM49041 TaxID=2603216 RepID=UPI0011EBF7D3|nr:class I SAM-dependent methyltransferase [Streptomyces sp. TRM49041]